MTWESGFCIHVAACIRGSSRAFNPLRRPWIDLDAESPERLVEIVEQCPTGALHARLLQTTPATEDGTATSDPAPHGPDSVEIDPRRNGPLFVRGPVRIVDQHGEVVREDTRMALCRCGASSNKPFCDGTHRRIGFRTD